MAYQTLTILLEKILQMNLICIPKKLMWPKSCQKRLARLKDIIKHNQKLISTLENQKIYGGFLKILIFWVSLSTTHLQNKWKPEISVF